MEKEDWKECLEEETRNILANIFEKIRKHKCAYMKADDVKVAQLWCAIAEMNKEIKEMTSLLRKIEEPFKSIVAIGEAEKKRTIEKFITQIIRPEREEEKEATRKLVESLMKF
ncbi:MAG: hypothetical protein QXX38_01540 [Candidatus Aenigmatarchaeota archaeon]